MKNLIVNGDDFGLSPGVNRGIITGFREGVLTSTTMMVNLPFFENAVNLAKDNPDLSMGIHLTLLWGKPVSDPSKIKSLVCHNGDFPNSLVVLSRRHFLGLLSIEEVKEEFRNQIKKFMDQGLVPTHLDTHKHIHSLSIIMKALISVAEEFGIKKMRLPLETPLGSANGANNTKSLRPPFKAICKRNLINLFCKMNNKLINNSGMIFPDHFIGMDYMDILDTNVLITILKNLDNGVTEIMCHPGYMDDHVLTYSRVPPYREKELKSLKNINIKEYIMKNNIQLISYKEL